jgi:hypothetical protein
VILENEQAVASSAAVEKPGLYVVWIDTNCGYRAPDWEMNSKPKSYELAEQEAGECLSLGFLSLILPEGQTPRPDGHFSNPATD